MPGGAVMAAGNVVSRRRAAELTPLKDAWLKAMALRYRVREYFIWVCNANYYNNRCIISLPIRVAE
jgi:hypothetical protein